MSTYQFVIAMLTAAPALLAALGAFWHSMTTKAALQARLTALEDKTLGH